MQKHTILINKSFSANTQPTTITLTGNGQSFLVNENSYFLNDTGGLNLGIVNPTNVRVYLNDPSNSVIISNFFSYLTANTTYSEFKEIFYSDQKLSNVFNNYYEKTIFSGQQSSTYYISQELTGTTELKTFYSNFNWDGYSNSKQLTGVTEEIYNATRFTNQNSSLVTYSLDDSYFVPIFIKKNYIRESYKMLYFDEIINVIEEENLNINYYYYINTPIGLPNLEDTISPIPNPTPTDSFVSYYSYYYNTAIGLKNFN